MHLLLRENQLRKSGGVAVSYDIDTSDKYSNILKNVRIYDHEESETARKIL